RSAMLIETKIAELEAGIVRPEGINDELEGNFGTLYPGYSWSIVAETTENPEVYLLRIEVGYNPAAAQQLIDNPDYTYRFDEPGTRVLQTTYRLYPVPARVEIERDFGLSREELEKFLGVLGAQGAVDELGGEGALPGGNEGGGGGGGGGGGSLPPGLDDLQS